MTLSKFEENGRTYFQLYIGCPVCLERGTNTPRSYWTHGDANCNGDIYVGDNAYYKCSKCGRSSHVKNWGYNCPTHSSIPDEFVRVSAATLAKAIGTAAQMVTEVGLQWYQEFLKNMGEW